MSNIIVQIHQILWLRNLKMSFEALDQFGSCIFNETLVRCTSPLTLATPLIDALIFQEFVDYRLEYSHGRKFVPYECLLDPPL